MASIPAEHVKAAREDIDSEAARVVSAHKNTLARRNTLGYLQGHSIAQMVRDDPGSSAPVKKKRVSVKTMFPPQTLSPQPQPKSYQQRSLDSAPNTLTDSGGVVT